MMMFVLWIAGNLMKDTKGGGSAQSDSHIVGMRLYRAPVGS